MTRLSGTLAQVPIALLAAGFWALAWREQGSVLAEDWLAYALAAGLLVATVLASRTAFRPPRGLLAGLAALVALALWTGLSASWSPVPALARDEALLVLFYTLALAVPLLTLRAQSARSIAIALVVAASASLVVATCVRLVTDDNVSDLYWSARLASPIGYPGAEAAVFLVSFWPAAALAASQRFPVAARTLAFAGSVAILAGWLMTQSRAGAVSLAVSAVVVFALAPARLRLLVPVGFAASLVGLSYGPLTGPFREREAEFDAAIEHAGRWALLLIASAVLLGLLYTLADSRIAVPRSFVRIAGVATLAAVALGTATGLGGFLVAVDEPGEYLEERWEDFKRQPERETGSSHLVSIGSNRYDFWRVELNEFREHPLAGAGGRSFGTSYLREGRTGETPQRGHSLEFDLLSETGVPGLLFLVGGLLPFLWAGFDRARSDLVSAGVFGAVVYWVVHASGDWIWTFPAAALPFFLLLGAGGAGRDDRRIVSRAAVPAGLGLGAAVLLLFAPPWLSSRYTARALEQTSAEAVGELRWARRLDPLSVDPLIAEAELARSPEQAIKPLEEAIEREPSSLAPRYLLGLAYLEAQRREQARRELREALRLAPRSSAVRSALRRAEAARKGG